MKLKYEMGDPCWIAIGEPPLWEGRVVGAYNTPDHPADFYIIEIMHPDWPTHEIRDALLMSDTEAGPLAYMAYGVGDTESALLDAAKIRALVDNMEGVRFNDEH